MKVVVIILVVLLLIWITWSYFGTRNIERPRILSSKMIGSGIELREVAPMIQATVVVSGQQKEAIINGFRQLAGYIFGGNTTKESVSMTAPVALSRSSESIAMTAPVALQKDGGAYHVSFMMPHKYTLDTLPKPNNKNIAFVEMPAKKYYVWKFSRYATESRVNKQLALFLTALKSQNKKHAATSILNQYNDPWTMPLMRKNELWIEAE